MQTVSVTPVVGLPQVQGWSQSVDHAYGGVHLVGTIAVSGENASGVGRDILGLILEQELRNAQHLYQFVEYLQGIASEKSCDLSVTLGIFYLGRCTVCSRQGSVWLKRAAKVGALVEARSEIALIQGSVKEDDVFIFATQQAEQFLSTVELQFGQGFDVDGVITSIVPAIHGLENSALSAISFVTISTKSESEYKHEEYVVHPAAVEPVKVQNDLDIPEALQAQSDHLETSVPTERSASGTTDGIPLDHFINFFKNLPKLFSKKTYVGNHLQKKSVLWILGIGLLVAVGIGIGIYYVLHLHAEQAFAKELITPYEQQLTSAKTTAEQDPISARAQIETVIAELVQLQAEYTKSGRTVVVEKLEGMVTTARATEAEVSGKQEFADLPIFYDLRLASQGFLTTFTTLQGQKAVFIDAQKKTLVVLDLPTKQFLSLELSSLDAVKAVSPQRDEAVALIAGGVYSVGLTADSQPATIKELGDSNRAATFLNTFGSYVYVFNPEKRNIYRYSKAEKSDTYSDPIGWLQDPLGVSFDSIKSLMIDGDVWLSTEKGEILKFSAGKKASFAVTGMSEPFSTPTFLFTQEATTNLYALEPEKKRLVVLTKSGQFLREVRSNSLASATGFFVQEQLGKAFVVSGSIIYEVTL